MLVEHKGKSEGSPPFKSCYTEELLLQERKDRKGKIGCFERGSGVGWLVACWLRMCTEHLGQEENTIASSSLATVRRLRTVNGLWSPQRGKKRPFKRGTLQFFRTSFPFRSFSIPKKAKKTSNKTPLSFLYRFLGHAILREAHDGEALHARLATASRGGWPHEQGEPIFSRMCEAKCLWKLLEGIRWLG